MLNCFAMGTLFLYLSALAGWGLGILSDLATRNRRSRRSPSKFSFSFWIKDNYRKWGISLTSALIITFVLSRNSESLFGFVFVEWMALVVGLSPDAVLSFLKQRFGVLKPESVDGYDRTACNEE